MSVTASNPLPPPTRARASAAPLALACLMAVVPWLSAAQPAEAQDRGCEELALPGGEGEKTRTRRRPGRDTVTECVPLGSQDDSDAGADARPSPPGQRYLFRRPGPVSPVPQVGADDYADPVPLPDRWRIVEAIGYRERWYDPYNRNVLKGDRPLHDDWFVSLGIISDTVFEARKVPTPVGIQSTAGADALDVLGGNEQSLLNQNLAVELVYYKGDTVFKPPDYEFRFTPVFNVNRTELDEILGVNVNPSSGKTRNDNHVGIQAAFVDMHLRNVNERYDFDSIRVGIQPLSSDFRGFLFQDNQLGIRLFGTRDNNLYQYNLGWFRRVEKDTNSGLNDVNQPLRDDDILFANLYRQDFPVLGFTSQAIAAYNRNREDGEFYFDNNGFLARPAALGIEVPRAYDVGYAGYNGDGHFGRLNLTVSAYLAVGEEDTSTFTRQSADIRAFFAAAEASVDFDWIRVRGSVLYGSGDNDPFDDKAEGYDAIFENPQFAGADTSYWIRQGVPLIGGGRVSLSSRNGILNSMRSSKEQGQSNFTNPGIALLGTGADLDLTPTTRLSFNLNYLRFADTAVLEVARNQGDISNEIGLDLSAALIYRPFMSQNIVVRMSYGKLLPGAGFKDLYGSGSADSLLANIIFIY